MLCLLTTAKPVEIKTEQPIKEVKTMMRSISGFSLLLVVLVGAILWIGCSNEGYESQAASQRNQRSADSEKGFGGPHAGAEPQFAVEITSHDQNAKVGMQTVLK
jgi:hypothetical protein